MKIAVTGSNGFIGNAFIMWVNWNQSDVTVQWFDDNDCINRGMDLRDVEVVYHFAAWPYEHASHYLPKAIYHNNLIGTVNVVNHCIRQRCRLVFISSAAVFGNGADCSEVGELRPIDPYGVSKAAAEMHIRTAGDYHGLDYVIVRLANVYGPGQHYQKVRNVFANWMCEPTIRITGTGGQRRHFTYIDDILPALWKTQSHSGCVFHVANPRARTVLEAAVIMKELTGKPIEYVPCRREAYYNKISSAASSAILDLDDFTELEVGLPQAWGWFQERGENRDATALILSHQEIHSSPRPMVLK